MEREVEIVQRTLPDADNFTLDVAALYTRGLSALRLENKIVPIEISCKICQILYKL